MNKLEILKQELHGEELEFLSDNMGNVFDAMEVYTKQEAMEFAVFCANNVLGVFPAEQLYELFLQSKGK